MAIVPLSGTDIRILKDVPFSNDYKHTRWFESETIQQFYFINKPNVHIMEQANIQLANDSHFIAVNKHRDALQYANYLMFRNTDYNNKWFYAFITKLEYVQKNVTYVHFQIDVLQTWLFVMNFKPSFVVREHCKLWNEDGGPVINTVDEGLNYGTDYEVKSVTNYIPHDPIYFLVIVTKSAMHYANTVSYKNVILPVNNGLPQPLTYYVHPFKMNGEIPNVVVGVDSLPISSIEDVFKGLYTQTGSVNNVVSIYVTEFLGAPYVDVDVSNDTVTFPDSFFEGASVADDENTTINTVHLKGLYEYASQTVTIDAKYADYDSVSESKLLMYPYTVLILDDFKGNRVVLKNEYIENTNIRIMTKGSIGTSNKVAYSVTDYLQNTIISSLENSVINNSPNDLPIISDYLSAYLQGNRNSIENQKTAIGFNGFMSMLGGAYAGGLPSKSGSTANIGALNVVQGLGNTVLELQAIQAKIKDIDNVPPSLVKMGGNANFDFGNGVRGVFIIKKQITPEYQKKLTDFFKMFGYKVNEVKTPNFHTRENWNYVQTSSCNITGNINNEDLRELTQIFDNGITLWHTDDVGNYSLGNEVI